MEAVRFDDAKHHRVGKPEARLALVDALLECGDPGDCAAAVLDWLCRHSGVCRGLCLMIDPDVDELRGIAAIGIDEPNATVAVANLHERTHPLVIALESREPVLFSPADEGDRYPPTPLGATPFLAAPLASISASERSAFGLLLVTMHDDRATGEADERLLGWAADALGVRLAALGYARARNSEQRLQREANRLKGVIEAVTDPILLTDSDGRILVSNSGAEHLLTVDPEAGEGRRRAVSLNNMLFSASLFTNVEQGEATRRELLLADPVDGQDLLFELLTSPFPLTRGDVGTVSVLRDVNDLSRATQEIEENYRRLRTAEAEIRAERDRLDVILSSELDPIVVTDWGGNIVLMNPPAERLFTVPETTRSRQADLRVRSNDAVFTSFASDIYAGRSLRWKKDLSLIDPETGRQIPMKAVSAKTRAKPGKDAAVVTILHDQSEAVEKTRLYEKVKHHSQELEQRVREATRELAEQNELLRRQALQLEQASAMKSQFLANVSHELRTPLHAVVGYTSLLLEGVSGELTPKQREKLSRVDSNASHLLAIIDDLLDLARIESGKMPVRTETFRIADVFREVRSESESLIDGSGLEVRFDAGEGIAPIVSDRKKVKQILLNLLSNALKFTPAGHVRIEAVHDPDAGRVRIAVADTGIGISPENQQTIFEAFGQSETIFTVKQNGTGLGLSICRRLAEVLDGEITLDSELGVGSTFTLVLPVRAEEP